MTYSISDLEQLTGVQTHTIRIWERRYNALTPLRSAGNTRFYDDGHLRRLLNIASLSQSGIKISEACGLSEVEISTLLEREVESTHTQNMHCEYYISQLLSYGLNYNEVGFSKLLSKCIITYGLRDAYILVIYPLLTRLGLLWRKDDVYPAQEHFLVNILRQKLYTAIDELESTPTSSASWLLSLPEDEDHDIGLLIASYLLKLAGQNVIYLGARVPLMSVVEVVKNVPIDRFLLFMVRSRPVASLDKYLKDLSSAFTDKEIYIAGSGKLRGDIQLARNLKWCTTISDFEQVINPSTDVNQLK